MLPFKLVYHEEYDLHLGSHVFPSQKYRLVKETLIAENIASPENFLKPELAADADVLRVHTTDYIHRIKSHALTASEQMLLEIPAGPETVRAFWLAAGGSILAGQRAMRDGFAANIGGGFHHAYPGHGEGFCMIHDVAIAIRRLQVDDTISRAMVVDTDVHHGNGTAAIFATDESVFTFSIHQLNNYPARKPASNIDLNLRDQIGDEDYLSILDEGMSRALKEFQPDIIFYIAGADPYREDQLGGLALTIEGLRERDRLIFRYARKNNIPVAITQAGGYARNVADTVKIHVNTIVAARDALRRA